MPKTVKATKKRKQDGANFKTYIARARTRGACGGAREGAGGRGVLYDIDFGPRCAARRSGRSVGGSCGVPGADAHGAAGSDTHFRLSPPVYPWPCTIAPRTHVTHTA